VGGSADGLTAQKENAAVLVELTDVAWQHPRRDGRRSVPRILVGFHGQLRRPVPIASGQPILNLDIGGGTTNLALGITARSCGPAVCLSALGTCNWCRVRIAS